MSDVDGKAAGYYIQKNMLPVTSLRVSAAYEAIHNNGEAESLLEAFYGLLRALRSLAMTVFAGLPLVPKSLLL